MSFLHTVFKPYCERAGIHLLKDDFTFIQNQLYKIPQNAHKDVLRQYCKIWLAELRIQENASYSQNLGRRKANEYLSSACRK